MLSGFYQSSKTKIIVHYDLKDKIIYLFSSCGLSIYTENIFSLYVYCLFLYYV